MRISVQDAQRNLEELVDRADKGEDILLTRDGNPIARIVLLNTVETPTKNTEDFATLLRAIKEQARQTADPFPEETAARSQDFLYDGDGIPK
ncbi:type II toxin-antitoxin system Phd/YefM family antitoxin [Peteryoungia ipomoeae]|uniref:Antitoxin n=1 Tax=Peteryoungia ipomoeae TaxID=1210932 RepID=A0A4V4HMB5_9HYPH|nr:type II toxin-antitoxin system prevent-host-death family antitoxin [Peteryoungia ipomoeae]THV21586.1 type II toxin-antitoxin system prevent-host-death family antitoxin [Peteryoungia ipomoeae]